jgi:hypothetical protein
MTATMLVTVLLPEHEWRVREGSSRTDGRAWR